ncbi:S66 peptidase family protein [Bacillus massilioanorexius]|uniref:S66 peptidase family protein n=1 Tax=Bacillus TaxID=1386 RepID=UPI001651E668
MKLKMGDTVGIISPASPCDEESLQKGIVYLEGLGLRVKLGKNVYNQYGYLAGQDEARLADLHNMFADKQVKGIFCSRGGYGTARIAAQIDYQMIARNPKIFWGYSDITFLHTTIRQNSQLVTFHGPMIASDIAKDEWDRMSSFYFEQIFHQEKIVYDEKIAPIDVLVEGSAEGELVGGNLSLLVSTLGTSYELDTKGKILFIEDIDEQPRSVDRLLNQLLMAGKLQDISGFVIGDFHNCKPKQKAKSLTLDQVISHYVQLVNKPTLKGLKIGHCFPNISIPMGTSASINTEKKQLIIDSGLS